MTRIWHPNADGEVWAVITDDDGEVYTVEPNNAVTAAREASLANGEVVLLQFTDPARRRWGA